MSKKILLLISCSILLFGCDTDIKLEKPFIVIKKFINHDFSDNKCLYVYQDKHGHETTFVDTNEKYSIGDTIR